MATSVTTETLNGDLCKLPPDPGKSPGPWKRSKEDGNQPLSFRDVLMQVQHKGSYYLEISEPESEGFKSDEKSLTRSLEEIKPLFRRFID